MASPQLSLSGVTSRLVPAIRSHQASASSSQPFLLGLTGLQGSGKSTWAEALTRYLETEQKLRVVNVSLDDFYHAHPQLVALREDNPGNTLLAQRGQPGTHDERLASAFFANLANSDVREVRVPSFDKSRFDGEGDRVEESRWSQVSKPIDVVIFEGWCVGFRPIEAAEVQSRWEQAKSRIQQKSKSPSPRDADDDNVNVAYGSTFPTNTLAAHPLAHLQLINANLRRYASTFMQPSRFDFFVHLDTDNLVNVYRWRIDQEHALRKAKGAGMSDEAVVKFVQGYMPSYELFLDGLRARPLVEGAHVRVVLDRNRTVVKVEDV